MIDSPMLQTNKVIRNSNFIGKGNFQDDPNPNAIYDEIKIYQGALTPAEILNEYENGSINNGKH